MAYDPPIFVVNTPVQLVPKVTLLTSTWRNHIVPGHPELAGLQDSVEIVVETPTTVYMSPENDYHRSAVIFSNSSIINGLGKSLAVVVDPTQRLVQTAYFPRKDLALTSVVIWPEK